MADIYPTNTPHVFHIVLNLTILSSTTDKIKGISKHFWDRQRHEYIVNLHETQQTSKLNINSPKTDINNIVLVYTDKAREQKFR